MREFVAARPSTWLVAPLLLAAGTVLADDRPLWIGPPRNADSPCVVTKSFEAPSVRSARLFAVADFCDAEFFVGEARVAARRAYEKPVDPRRRRASDRRRERVAGRDATG